MLSISPEKNYVLTTIGIDNNVDAVFGLARCAVCADQEPATPAELRLWASDTAMGEYEGGTSGEQPFVGVLAVAMAVAVVTD